MAASPQQKPQSPQQKPQVAQKAAPKVDAPAAEESDEDLDD